MAEYRLVFDGRALREWDALDGGGEANKHCRFRGRKVSGSFVLRKSTKRTSLSLGQGRAECPAPDSKKFFAELFSKKATSSYKERR